MPNRSRERVLALVCLLAPVLLHCGSSDGTGGFTWSGSPTAEPTIEVAPAP